MVANVMTDQQARKRMNKSWILQVRRYSQISEIRGCSRLGEGKYRHNERAAFADDLACVNCILWTDDTAWIFPSIRVVL